MIFDLIAGMNADGGAAVWTPAELFQNGEIGFWLDGSDLSTMFQDSNATTPVTTSGQPVGTWKNKIAGQTTYDFKQATAASKPTYEESFGKHRVSYDGVDDILSNATSGTIANNGVTICLGQVRRANQSVGAYVAASSSRAVLLSNETTGEMSAEAFQSFVQSTAVTSNSSPNVITVKALPNMTPLSIKINGVTKSSASPPSGVQLEGIKDIVGSVANICKISQFVFINRMISVEEQTQLETFIGSKQ